MIWKILAGALGLSMVSNAYLLTRNDTIRTQLTEVSVSLQACGARLANIMEDVKSDNEIDAIDDLRNFDIPDGWLFDPEN